MKKVFLILVIATLVFASLGCHGIWTKEAQLKAIVIDGRLIKGFKPWVYEYTYVVDNPEKIPVVIGVPEEADFTVSYHYPEELPGIITISVTPGSHPGTKLRETFYRVEVLVANGI